MTTIIIIGFAQALFFMFLAMSKKQKGTADYILAALFLLIAYQLGANFVMLTEYKYRLPNIIGTSGPITFLYGPLLFFFIWFYISGKQKFRAVHMLHFLPFVADYVHGFFTFYFLPPDEKINILNEIMAGKPDTEMSVVLILRALSPFIYAVWSTLILRKHRKNIIHLYSFTSYSLRLEWLWNLTLSMLIVSAITVFTTFMIVFSDVIDWVELRKFNLVVGVIWVFFLGYYSVRKTPFYRTFPVKGLEKLNTVEIKDELSGKYEKTRLNEADTRALSKKLVGYMEKEKPYLNKNLTIGELAAALDVPVHHLSQVINSDIGLSFFNFINHYRIEEIKRRFADPEHGNLTLLGIAMTCGFNSKTSFNRTFKQFTGQTPSEYMRKQQAA